MATTQNSTRRNMAFLCLIYFIPLDTPKGKSYVFGNYLFSTDYSMEVFIMVENIKEIVLTIASLNPFFVVALVSLVIAGLAIYALIQREKKHGKT